MNISYQILVDVNSKLMNPISNWVDQTKKWVNGNQTRVDLNKKWLDPIKKWVDLIKNESL